jgi:predicted ATPase
MTLIRELIAIPEQVHQGDFVLKLADGVAHAETTLSDYVVTPQLNACFNDALNFIKQSVQGGTSKAAYLHGSFGSGKSHFMAVTQPAARQQRVGTLDARSGRRRRPAQQLDAGPQVPARPRIT